MPIVTHGDAFVSRWTVRPEKRADFITQFNALWRDNTEIMNEVTNFVFYGWGRNPDEFVAIESWKSNEAVAAMRQSEGFKIAVAALMTCCSAPMVMELYSPWEGGREVFETYPVGDSQVHPRAGAIHAVFV
jgi:quinol monooxygenase YgiN